eukprot:scaffold171_cov263-Pinguiococcus_pyrenoidosus.AAC.11
MSPGKPAKDASVLRRSRDKFRPLPTPLPRPQPDSGALRKDRAPSGWAFDFSLSQAPAPSALWAYLGATWPRRTRISPGKRRAAIGSLCAPAFCWAKVELCRSRAWVRQPKSGLMSSLAEVRAKPFQLPSVFVKHSGAPGHPRTRAVPTKQLALRDF